MALDRSEKNPLIALTAHRFSHLMPEAPRPYLTDGRWDVWNLTIESEKFSFDTRGYGAGVLTWKVPQTGAFEVILRQGNERQRNGNYQVSDLGILNIQIESGNNQPIRVEARKVSD